MSSNNDSSNSGRNRSRISLLSSFESPVVVKVGLIVCSVIIVTHALSVSSSVTSALQSKITTALLDDLVVTREQKSQPKPATSPAMDIVNNAYSRTYAGFVSFCSSREGDDRHIKSCMESFINANFSIPSLLSSHYSFSNSSLAPTTGTASVPWWFKTMVRDGHRMGSGLFGGWHFLSSDNPPLDFCSIEKVGTKKFKKFVCHLNNKTSSDRRCFMYQRPPPPPQRPPKIGPANDGNTKDDATTTTWSPPPLPIKPIKATFLRDPLERFLSGFIDKCVLDSRRKNEKHCEPNQVYRENEELLNELLIVDRQKFFEAYVNTFPLKWNLHFFPQSFYCNGGLFLEDYDFIGIMGHEFYDQLYYFGQKYGKGYTLMESLDAIFDATENHKKSKVNTGTERQAASHIEEYFNARTVERLLEYFSIDYVLLNLTIPSWVDEILLQSN